MLHPDRIQQGEHASGARVRSVDVLLIRQMYLNGAKQSDLASRYGLSQSGISRIVSGSRWKHIV